MPEPTVGVLGAGRIGLPIVGHLVRAGFPAVVYDPGPDRRGLIEDRGGRIAASAAEVAQAGAVILVCVGYQEQVDALLTGTDGLLPQLKPDTVVAVLSTVAPDRVIELARAAQPPPTAGNCCRSWAGRPRWWNGSPPCWAATAAMWSGPGTWARPRSPRRSTT